MDKLMSALSLCRKAGVLVQGFDAVQESVFKGTAFLVLTACDLSDGTKRRVHKFCEEMIEEFELPYTQIDLLMVSRKATGVFSVCDENLAKLCRKHLEEKQ